MPLVIDVLMVLAVGLVAGALTTVAGFGGGLLVTLMLSLAWGPHAALATAAGALIVGNAHRFVQVRREVERARTLPMAIGAAIGAVGGGLVTARLPADSIRWMLAAVTLLAVVRAIGWLRFEVRRAVLVPGGAAVGFLTATTGGGGLLLAPLMLAAGLRDLQFLAAGTVVALAVHLARIGAYASSGMMGVEHLALSLVLAAGLVGGNMTGWRVRARIPARVREGSTWFVLICGLALAMAGLAGPS